VQIAAAAADDDPESATMFFGGGIPFMFPGGPGGGGFPGGPGGPGGDDDDGPGKEVDNTKFYTVLGLEKDATASDIKKAYMRLARAVRCAPRPLSFPVPPLCRHFRAGEVGPGVANCPACARDPRAYTAPLTVACYSTPCV
jgi:hypothetical protein